MKIDKNDIERFVHLNIADFHNSKLDSLRNLRLTTILKRKNPYLYRAKNILTAHDFVEYLLKAYLTSQEETLFGQFLEKLAIYVCSIAKGGYKSGIEGVDLEFNENDTRYVITIKSGPNWGNSSQINKMKDDFRKAARILRTSNSRMNIKFINGCCYGVDDSPDKGEYLKLCGQRFWEFITDDEDFYLEIVEPLGYEAKIRNEAFGREYAKVVNGFTELFIKDFCCEDKSIDWEKIVKLNSAKRMD